MQKVLVGVVLLGALIGGAWWLQTSGALTAEDLPVAVPIDPPEGAILLEEEYKPAAVVSQALAPRDPGERESAIDSFIGCWVAERGWRGEAEEVRVGNGITRFAVEVHDTTMIGMCFVVCEVPGSVDELENGRPVHFRGRIKDIRPSPDLMTQPHRLILDQVTVIRVG